ncbi:hypothetical protein Tco_1125607 [Tanacetum coccineum]|uniref:Reverse transcriptase domain-containing protein n=1 Tax=Tanacetum coccineum TaxID=301880 RepID=A0ABQ5J9G2_9ASTR
MQTRSSSKFVSESSTNPISMNPKRRNRRRSKQRVEPFALEEIPVVTMVDQRTMAELLRAPIEGYAEAIVVPLIPAEHFELKHSLINLVTSKQFYGFEDPHAHIRYFNKITSTLRYKDVPETSIKLLLFPFSIDGPARIWLDKEPHRSILTWDDLISSLASALIELSSDVELKDIIMVAMPKLVGFKPTKKVYRPVSNKISANTSGQKKQAELSSQKVNNSNPFYALNSIEDDDYLGTNGGNSKSDGKGYLNVAHGSYSNTPIIEKIDKLESQILNGKLTFVDDDRKPLYKAVTKGNEDSESEVEAVFDVTANLMASTSLKGGSDSTNCLLEQWRGTKRDDDYDPYKDDLYESHDISEDL